MGPPRLKFSLEKLILVVAKDSIKQKLTGLPES